MKFLKQFTVFRFYLLICALCVSAFSYAEYYGYVLTGSDENQRENASGYHGSGHGSTIHHK